MAAFYLFDFLKQVDQALCLFDGVKPATPHDRFLKVNSVLRAKDPARINAEFDALLTEYQEKYPKYYPERSQKYVLNNIATFRQLLTPVRAWVAAEFGKRSE